MCPMVHFERHKAPKLRDWFVPGVAIVIDDGIAGHEHAVRVPFIVYDLLDVFCGLSLGTLAKAAHGDAGGVRRASLTHAHLIEQQC